MLGTVEASKRAPVTGTRVVRSKGDVRSPAKGGVLPHGAGSAFATHLNNESPQLNSSQRSAGSCVSDGASDEAGALSPPRGTSEDKKRRPYTTPSRPGDIKRTPSTPTRTVRPYRPSTGGGVDRVASPETPPQPTISMLAVVSPEPPLVLVSNGNTPDSPVEEYIEEECLDGRPVQWVEDTPPPVVASTSPRVPKPPPAAAPTVSMNTSAASASAPPTPTPSSLSSATTAITFGREGSKVRTGSKTLIGKGSFGCVFKGLHEGTNQIVAIKEVHLTGESAAKVKLIKKEIHLMKKLNHPNIVRYLGAERVKTQLHIYLEYVTGGSMASLVKEYGPLTEDMTRKYSRQVLEGLHYLHENNIVHRDIKGDNLLVGTDGAVKLADFGTSKELRTLAATVTGTACFMAPEVIKGTGHGLASDVWSLGCAVIEMLTGRPPFCSFANQYATMMHIAELNNTDAHIPVNVSAEAQDFLRRCLRVDPGERDTTAQLLCAPWFANHPEDFASAPVPSGPAPIPLSPVDNDPLLQSSHSNQPECQKPPSPPSTCTESIDSLSDDGFDNTTSSFNPMLSYDGTG